MTKQYSKFKLNVNSLAKNLYYSSNPQFEYKNKHSDKRLFELSGAVENIRTKFMNLALNKNIFISDLR